MYKEMEDTKLVQLSQTGDPEAFNQLVLKYQDRIFNTIARLVGDYELANDLVQETFVNAYQGLKKFRLEASFFTWLFRIAINLTTSARRQYARKKSVSLTRYEDGEAKQWLEPACEQTPAEVLEQKEREKHVQAAIASLEDPFRTALVLRDIEDLSYEEIQDILNCPIGTVRSRIHRARTLLKEKLEKFYQSK